MTKARGEMKERRKPYRKPQVEQVELVPDEAVLGGCKVDNVVGGNGGFQGMHCLDVGSPCYTQLLS